jgi:hypothetical protein
MDNFAGSEENDFAGGQDSGEEDNAAMEFSLFY